MGRIACISGWSGFCRLAIGAPAILKTEGGLAARQQTSDEHDL
jgi:hypothetical protein